MASGAVAHPKNRPDDWTDDGPTDEGTAEVQAVVIPMTDKAANRLSEKRFMTRVQPLDR
jgi:hypothetical protein